MSPEAQLADVEPFDVRFRRVWFEKLNRLLPLPALLAGASVVTRSEVIWVTGLGVVAYIAFNVITSQLVISGGSPARFDLLRAGGNAAALFGVSLLGGPFASAWVLALPVALAAPFLDTELGAHVNRVVGFTAVTAGAALAGAAAADLVLGLTVLAIVAYLTAKLHGALKAGSRVEDEQRRELAHRQEVLERALAARQAFLANMSHEIRTPLNGVLGMAELLEHTRLDEEQRRMLGVVRSAGQGLLTTINDILDLAKLDAGRVALERGAFDVAALGEQIVDLLRAGVDAERVRLRLEASGLPTVITDPMRLRQVLLNLVGNAIKFTSDGEIVVALSHREEALTVLVRDTGIGIAREHLERLFEPFEQGDTSTSRRFGGTGLGLAISHRMVALLGGKLWVESVEGEGSTFGFTVPAPRSELPTPNVETFPSAPRDLRVLVVDDNAVNLRVAQAMLQRIGCRVTAVDSGEAALEAAERSRFDVVLMDCQMPVMDGFEATARLRERGLECPVLALTAGVTPEEQARCLEAGMEAVVAKPVTLASLEGALARAVPALRPVQVSPSSGAPEGRLASMRST